MEGLIIKENPERLATLDIQETRHINVREYLKGNEKGQSRKKLATQVIQETRQIRTIQRNWQHRFIRHRTQINVREYGRVNEKRKSKETGNIGYTTDKTNTCQIAEGVMKKDNPNKLAAQGS